MCKNEGEARCLYAQTSTWAKHAGITLRKKLLRNNYKDKHVQKQTTESSTEPYLADWEDFQRLHNKRITIPAICLVSSTIHFI